MKKLLSALLILAMFASLTACGENAPEDDGKIDVYVLVEFQGGTITHDEAGRITKAVYSNGSFEEYTYTEDGRLSCYTKGLPDIEEPYETQEYRYDDTTGIVTYVEYTSYGTANGFEPLRLQWQYLYDKQGRLTQGNYGWLFRYTENGKLAAVEYDQDQATHYEYDTQGRLIRRTKINTYEDETGQYGSVTHFEYDEENRFARQITMDENGEELNRLEFVYEGEFATADLGNGYTAKYQKVSMTPEQVLNCYIVRPLNTRAPIYLCNECTDPYPY